MNHPSLDALVVLLEQVGAAHGEYETGELHGVYDQQWSAWYAAYLVAHNVNHLLPTLVTAERLGALLAEYDQAQRQRTSQPWPRYYAERLLNE